MAKIITSVETMHAALTREMIVEPLRHIVFHLATTEGGKNYYVHNNTELMSTCLDFQKREKDSKPYLACKNIYFIFIHVLGLN